MLKLTTMFATIVFSVVAITSATAQGNEPPIPVKPPDGEYILDTLDWLTESQEAEITAIVSALDGEGKAEIFVVTLDDCGTNKTSYRKKILDEWGIGHADNDGLLILVCWYGGDESRRSVEQQYGEGLSSVLSGAKMDQVAREGFVPAFQNNQPGSGLVAMIQTYEQILNTGNMSQNNIPNFNEYLNEWAKALLKLLLIGGVVVFLIAVTQNNRSYSGGVGGVGGVGGDGGGGDGGGGDGGGSSTGF